MSLMRSKTVFLENLGEGREATVYELPYGAQMDIHKSNVAEDGMVGAITLKYALHDEPEFEGKTVEEIRYLIPMRLLSELTTHLDDLMEINVEELEKNLESDPTEDSVSH